MKKKFLEIDRKKRRQPGHLFHDATEDKLLALHKEKPPYVEAQVNSASYRLAFDDIDYLFADEQRPLRLLMELDKPEAELNAHGIEHTVVIFGSARTKESNPQYQQARELAKHISIKSGCDNCPKLHVVTGGGPGIMEAANRGANEAGHESIGLNIVLPHEQYPNAFITPELCFRFHYFAIRKMHFLLRARAIVAFPGGFGTMDEVFEALTLVQTGKIEPLPILLFGSEYWQRLINFDVFIEEGMASQDDMDHFAFVDSIDEAWDIIRQTMVDE